MPVPIAHWLHNMATDSWAVPLPQGKNSQNPWNRWNANCSWSPVVCHSGRSGSKCSRKVLWKRPPQCATSLASIRISNDRSCCPPRWAGKFAMYRRIRWHRARWESFPCRCSIWLWTSPNRQFPANSSQGWPHWWPSETWCTRRTTSIPCAVTWADPTVSTEYQSTSSRI